MGLDRCEEPGGVDRRIELYVEQFQHPDGLKQSNNIKMALLIGGLWRLDHESLQMESRRVWGERCGFQKHIHYIQGLD